MESVKVISDNGVEINVDGIFYIFNSKYYFIYTTGEIVDNDYVRLYIVQVCKEIQNTPTGPIDTGYMLGMAISNTEEWGQVQQSITKIVEDKKNGTQNPEIQYLPITMLINLKIVSNNKFKLLKQLMIDDFKVTLSTPEVGSIENTTPVGLDNVIPVEEGLLTPIEPIQPNIPVEPEIISPVQSIETVDPIEPIQDITSTYDSENIGDVIIDYRARFFEEQEKNQALEEEIKMLKEKLENVKNIIG